MINLWRATEIAISFTALLQTFELWQLRECWGTQGAWSWKLIEPQFFWLPVFFRELFNQIMSGKLLVGFLMIRILLSLGLLVGVPSTPVFVIALALSTFLITLRWRGNFNGGSDSMTLIILFSMSLGSLASDREQGHRLALGYIGIQTALSYFLAGWVKVRNPLWRNGRALRSYLLSSRYRVPELVRRLSRARGFYGVASWSVILFECSFPLIFWKPDFSILYLVLGGFFHLINIYVFGLNRFFYAWVSAYPAVFFLATSLRRPI